MEAGAGDLPIREAAGLLSPEPSDLELWGRAVESVRSMAEVFVHGDVCENQLLVDQDLKVMTVLDWDTCGWGHLCTTSTRRVGIPLFRWEADFPRLRRAAWVAYQRARAGINLPTVEAVNLIFALAEMISLENRRRAARLDPWSESRLALRREALTAATEALRQGRGG